MNCGNSLRCGSCINNELKDQYLPSWGNGKVHLPWVTASAPDRNDKEQNSIIWPKTNPNLKWMSLDNSPRFDLSEGGVVRTQPWDLDLSVCLGDALCWDLDLLLCLAPSGCWDLALDLQLDTLLCLNLILNSLLDLSPLHTVPGTSAILWNHLGKNKTNTKIKQPYWQAKNKFWWPMVEAKPLLMLCFILFLYLERLPCLESGLAPCPEKQRHKSFYTSPNTMKTQSV